jgi:benzoyl-CoA reductase subunit D
MTVTAGIDVGSSAVKAVILAGGDGASFRILAHTTTRIRKRIVAQVVEETFEAVRSAAGVDEIDYVATTGEGEDTPFATGHFFGMTTHARGALFLEPRARAVLDVGALHARAMAVDPAGRVLNSRMTSQCASGSGQFLENIARYLGVSIDEVGALSRSATRPEAVSSICAVLAETDVINMVSRGISTPDILRGIHESMAGRFARLLQTLAVEGVVFVTGGLAADDGLLAALECALTPAGKPPALIPVRHELSAFAGALGAAIWGEYRYRKLTTGGVAWAKKATA